MDRKKAHQELDAICNSWVYLQELVRQKTTNDDMTKLLLDNKRFANCHKGKRCFILGNGPSLNEIDFCKLQNEYVFTVNELFRHEKYKQLNSNFHFFADPIFYQKEIADSDYISLLSDSFGTNTKLFLPIQGRKVLPPKKNKFDTYFFKTGLVLHDDYCGPIDFSKVIPGTDCVVHYASMLAIYMGFKEIILLGCDGTNAAYDLYARYTNNLAEMHAYKEDKSVSEKMNTYRKKKRILMTDTLNGYAKIFNQYRMIYSLAKKRKVKILNGNPNSIIDVIPIRAVNL